ncbi:Cytochrome b-c1 complex subunit 9, mitochondrial [Curvularia clavata]|uniref:Complex III subunit 9 n=1 Tax=Curvularia clavata TaxID=95742 RepID=A0A9Q8Z2U7_CURCL|nr:Cytochrome b-c1 complex subunit 9, mitochondrial [Curvularia clavata]
MSGSSRISFNRLQLTIDYSAVLRSNTTMLFTVFGAAFGLQLYVARTRGRKLMGDNRAFDTTSDKIWDSVNRGRQWKDIKHRYMEAAEDDE